MGAFSGIKGIILQFIIGGIIVAGTTTIAQKFSTKWAAVFWSFPFTLIPVVIIMYTSKENRNKISSFILQSVPSLINLMVFLLAFGFILKKLGFWKSFGISVSLWVVLSIVFILSVCPSPFKNGKCIKI